MKNVPIVKLGACASENDFARPDAVFRAMPNNPFPNHGWVNLTGVPETPDHLHGKRKTR
jgi:hypothetical protein